MQILRRDLLVARVIAVDDRLADPLLRSAVNDEIQVAQHGALAALGAVRLLEEQQTSQRDPLLAGDCRRDSVSTPATPGRIRPADRPAPHSRPYLWVPVPDPSIRATGEPLPRARSVASAMPRTSSTSRKCPPPSVSVFPRVPCEIERTPRHCAPRSDSRCPFAVGDLELHFRKSGCDPGIQGNSHVPFFIFYCVRRIVLCKGVNTRPSRAHRNRMSTRMHAAAGRVRAAASAQPRQGPDRSSHGPPAPGNY